MRLAISGSMHFAEKIVEVRNDLTRMGYEVAVSDFVKDFIGKSDEEKEKLKLEQKANYDVIMEFWNMMQGMEGLLVLNMDKNNIKNYIGGNTLMEIGFAHILNQKLFLYNPIPDISFYKSELESLNPIIINGELSLIK
ncbi:MAG TPA: hypothetical protein VGQ87_01690 [Patescibacteria group bacterium]|jgi:hypothetical protein|nr:hypothetical protein [Patescibacteria group bacterium]